MIGTSQATGGTASFQKAVADLLVTTVAPGSWPISRAVPLRAIVRRLALAGGHAGIGLAVVDGPVAFFQHWHLGTARKPR